MQADTPNVNHRIQAALADESATELCFASYIDPPPPLNVIDVQSIIECLRNTPRLHTLSIYRYSLLDAAVLNAFRNGLPLCTSITTVALEHANLGDKGLELLLPAFYNTSIASLYLSNNNIQGKRGGEVLRDLLDGNNTLVMLRLSGNPISQEGAGGLGQGMANNNNCLRTLELLACHIGNNGLANLLLSMGETNHHSLTNLDLTLNKIEGDEGGRQVTLLLQRFPTIRMLCLYNNALGPLGARALAPGLAAASHLESLQISRCGLGNQGVANLVPNGQVNRSLTRLELNSNDIEGEQVSGETVLALAGRCTNLDGPDSGLHVRYWEQERRLRLLLERKRRYNESQALGGAPSSVVFQKLVQANSHEHGLRASFVILRDYIFAEQRHQSRSGGQQSQVAAGVKRKRF